jgi:hypothetical protein
MKRTGTRICPCKTHKCESRNLLRSPRIIKRHLYLDSLTAAEEAAHVGKTVEEETASEDSNEFEGEIMSQGADEVDGVLSE